MVECTRAIKMNEQNSTIKEQLVDVIKFLYEVELCLMLLELKQDQLGNMQDIMLEQSITNSIIQEIICNASPFSRQCK